MERFRNADRAQPFPPNRVARNKAALLSLRPPAGEGGAAMSSLHPSTSKAPSGHAFSSPRCLSALAIEEEVGKRGAWPCLPKLKYVARHMRPAGDFSARSILIPGDARAAAGRSVAGTSAATRLRLCATRRTRGSCCPPGRTGTDPPERPLRWRPRGGAGPSPRNHRRDRCSHGRNCDKAYARFKGGGQKLCVRRRRNRARD